jgi:alpha-ketoglutarate-dependent taurine dioxygenase
VCSRLGQEAYANSRGKEELGIHSDNATKPPAFFTLSCERPPIVGGKTIYIDSVAAVLTLPAETIDVLCKPAYAFDLIKGGVYQDEMREFLLPIIERDASGITVVRIQSRKDSILPQGEEAQEAYKAFRHAISRAERHEVQWERGLVVGSDNQKWCHCRTAFQEPANHPEGRWLLKVYSDR